MEPLNDTLEELIESVRDFCTKMDDLSDRISEIMARPLRYSK